VYDHYTTNADGCQDTLRLNLTINNCTQTKVTEAACTCYEWTGGDSATYTESGVYDHYTTNADGCQDTLRLNLTINNGTLTEVTEAACISYTEPKSDVEGYTEGGVYDHYTKNADGCQDTLRLNLTINNGTLTEVTEAACISCTGTAGDGATYTESGVYDHYTTNADGCQDTLRLNLTINNGTLTEVTEAACISY